MAVSAPAVLIKEKRRQSSKDSIPSPNATFYQTVHIDTQIILQEDGKKIANG